MINSNIYHGSVDAFAAVLVLDVLVPVQERVPCCWSVLVLLVHSNAIVGEVVRTNKEIPRDFVDTQCPQLEWKF